MLLALALLACSAPSGVVVLDTGDAPCDDDDTAAAAIPAPLLSGAFADTNVEDWMPVTAGNWANPLTADACDSATGPTCYDCVHVPTGTYARWFHVGTDYSDGQWFEASLGQLVFASFDAQAGEGLTTDGAYYGVDPAQACAAVYWLYK